MPSDLLLARFNRGGEVPPPPSAWGKSPGAKPAAKKSAKKEPAAKPAAKKSTSKKGAVGKQVTKKGGAKQASIVKKDPLSDELQAEAKKVIDAKIDIIKRLWVAVKERVWPEDAAVDPSTKANEIFQDGLAALTQWGHQESDDYLQSLEDFWEGDQGADDTDDEDPLPEDAEPKRGREEEGPPDSPVQRRRVGESKTHVYVKDQKPNSGELTASEAKKTSLPVETFFKDWRSLIYAEDSTIRIQSSILQEHIVHFNPISLHGTPIAWTAPWACLISQHPSISSTYESVKALVRKTKLGEPLIIQEGIPLECFGVMVQIYIEKLRAAKRTRDPNERSLGFRVHVGNLICSKGTILSAGKLDLEHTLTICEIAQGTGTALPEKPESATNPKPEKDENQVLDTSREVRHSGGGSRGGDRAGVGTDPTPKTSLRSPNQKCSICGGIGHKDEACTSRKGETLKCWQCGGIGHPKHNCPTKMKVRFKDE